MNPLLTTTLAVVLAYLLGSVSFAIVVSRVAGIADPRSFGSKNPGATNVLRSGHRGAAAATLPLVALAVFVGHLYPLYFGFKGGKGVATALGVLIAIAWWLGLASAATWLVIVFFFRYSSLAALVAAAFAPFFYALMVGFDAYAAAIVVMSAFIVYRHRKNIANLVAGSEPRIGSRTAASTTRR